MSRKYLIAGALAATAFTSVPASAATLLTSVTVEGFVGGATTGTVWDTDATNGFYNVFLQRPFGVNLNPTGAFAGFPVTPGTNNFLISGEGWVPGETVNSDLSYRLTLNFSDGASISGVYTFATTGGVFSGGTSATVGTTKYTLTGFGWDRTNADIVNANTAVEGGDPNDYTGLFRFTATAVPEPTTWALFILGFGAIGATMRRRSSQVRVAKASLNFA